MAGTGIDQASPAGDPRWSALQAFWATWLIPATAARRLRHVGLAKAFGIHVASGLVALLGVTGVISTLEHGNPFVIWGEMINAVARWPNEFLIGFSITFGVVEVLSVLLACLLLAWGAREERLRSSIYHSMRVPWLQSMSVAVAMVAMGGLIAVWESRVWRSGNWQARPWYSRHGAEILSYAAVALFTWAFWTMLRAAGARKVQPPADAPPTCQGCGYNLVATATDGACPECGESVLASVGPEARPGIEWENSRRHNSLAPPWTVALQAFRRFRSPPGMFMVCMALALLILGVWLAGVVSNARLYGFGSEIWWVVTPVVAVVGGLTVLVLLCRTQDVVGVEDVAAAGGLTVLVLLSLGGLRLWRATTWQAWREPRAFGRALHIYSPPAGHRRFLLVSMVLSALLGLAGAVFWLAGFICTPQTYGFTMDDFCWLVAPASAIATGLSVLVLSLLLAGGMGLLYTISADRNLMPVAMRCAAYLSGLLVIGLAVNLPMAFIFGLSSDIPLFDHVGHVLRIDDEETAFLGWCLFGLLCIGIYLRKFHLMLQGARHATR